MCTASIVWQTIHIFFPYLLFALIPVFANQSTKEGELHNCSGMLTIGILYDFYTKTIQQCLERIPQQ